MTHGPRMNMFLDGYLCIWNRRCLCLVTSFCKLTFNNTFSSWQKRLKPQMCCPVWRDEASLVYHIWWVMCLALYKYRRQNSCPVEFISEYIARPLGTASSAHHLQSSRCRDMTLRMRSRHHLAGPWILQILQHWQSHSLTCSFIFCWRSLKSGGQGPESGRS